MTQIIKFHSEQRMTPPVKEILKIAVKEVYGDEPVKFAKVKEPTADVLCFGTKGGIRTLSPKQIVSAPNAISVLVRSLQLAKDGVVVPELNYEVVGNQADFLATLTWMVEVGFEHPICADIETSPAPEQRVLSIAVTYGKNIVVFPEEFCQQPHLDKIVGALHAHYYVIGANWKYDAGVLLDHTGIKVPVWFDTMLAHHALHPSATGQHGLKQMAERILGVPDWDKDLQKYTGAGTKDKPKDFSKVPRDLLYKYNAYDVLYTFRLYAYFLPQITDDSPYWTEQSWANGFIDIEHNRVKLDLDAVVDLRDMLLAEEAKHEKVLHEFGIANVRSPKQILAVLQERAPDITGTDAKTLEAYADDARVAEIVEPLLAYRGAQKQRATYCDAYLRHEHEGFIHPTINIHGTASGRMSGSNPNCQNVPRNVDIRKMFVARGDNRVIVSCDYSQAELRVQAVLSGDPDMIAAFQPDSGDFFDLLMPVAFPEKYPTLEAFYAHKKQHPADAKEDRAKIKGVIYGLNFGRGAKAIAQALKMETSEAQDIIDNFMAGYPVYAQWRQKVVEAAVDPEKREFLTGPYGLVFDREVVTWRNEGSVQRSALSFLPQNCVSYICTTAAVRVNYRLQRTDWDAKVILAIHDDILVDCPEEHAEKVGGLLQYEMEEVAREVFGDTVRFDAEPEWSFRWGDMME